MLGQMFWRAFTWYYRTCNRLIDKMQALEVERWNHLTEQERQSLWRQRRHRRHMINAPIFTVFLFTSCVPLILGELTLHLADFPRAEWMLSWMIVFWIYFVFLAWLSPGR